MRANKKKPNSLVMRVVRNGYGEKAVGLKAGEIARLVLAKTLSDKRRLIKRRAGGGGSNPGYNASVARFASDRARKLKKKILINKRRKINTSLLMRGRVPSPILDGIDPQRADRWKKIISRRFRKTFPRVSLRSLNFIDSPIETMASLVSLSRAEQDFVNAYLDFDEKYCEDIGAYLVLSEIWQQLSPIFIGGTMNAPVQKVLSAVGLSRDLNIRLNAVQNHDNIWPFEIRRRRPRGTTQSPSALLRPQGREQLNDRLVDLIDQWLAVASANDSKAGDSIWVLTGDGRANIANMVGEILDNAERHSSGLGDGDWSMAAFMAKREEPGIAPAMKCYLAFLSVGRSIAETIENAPEKMKNFCDKYAKHHAREGQSYATMLTIAALQDGVTSAHDAAKNLRGGTGLQDTLAFIGDLGGAPGPAADVRVTIVSGKSCVRLRHPILVGTPDGSNRRVQWCNAANDPLYPPDREIAFDLPAHFAGTLVSVAFTLDPSLFVPEGADDGQSDD